MQLQRREVRSILIIDDDKDDFELVLEAIQQINPTISVTFISRCEEVAQFEGQSFDLVLLDINMPQSDGFHWLRSIREQGFKELPIVMYTNSMSPAHILKAYEEGANLYFSKPDTYLSLIKGFKELLALDWSNPIAITQQHIHRGRYSTFQFEG